MHSELSHILARQRAAELHRAAERRRLAREVPGAGAPQPSLDPPATRLTLRGHDLAKLDRFLVHAKRAALRDDRDFDGVKVEIDAEGIVTLNATGMKSIVL
jgi:hypothetical protein